MTRKRYSQDFKKQIVELYNSGKPVLNIEREYDLHASVIYGCIKRYNKSGSFKASENRTPEENRLIELEKENRQLKMENDILKQAALIMARK